MASLRQMKKGGNWVACFRDANGKQCNRSTRTTNRKAAMKIAWEWEDLARREKTVAEVREAAAEIWEKATGEKVTIYTLSGWLDEVLEGKRRSTAPATVKNWTYAIRSFVEVAGPKAEQDLSRIQAGDVNRWQIIEQERVHVNTVALYKRLLRTAFRRAVSEGHIKANPFEDSDPITKADPVRTKFSPEQVRDLLGVAPPDWKGMILLGLYGGMRIGDAARLTWKNVDMETGEIRYTPQKTGSRKGKHWFPIGGPLQSFIAGMDVPKKHTAPLFPELYDVKPCTLGQRFGKMMEQAGIERERAEKKGSRRTRHELSFHSLKHSLVTFLKMAGTPEAVAMKAVGHSSRAVSAAYTEVEDSDIRAAYLNLPDLLEEK